jgi:tetratricopeptide (TPR) repeat protein
MKTYLLSTALAAATMIAASPAVATDITIGSSLASACYRSSMAGILPRFALIECDRAIGEEMMSDHDRAATHVNRGIVKMRMGDLIGADEDFDTALELHGADAEAMLNKGFLRLRQGQFQAALPYLDRSIEAQTIRPALAHYARAVVYEELGNVRAAYADLVRARDADPSWATPTRELARFKVSGR